MIDGPSRAQAWPLPAAIRGASPDSNSTLGKHASRDPRRGSLQETVNELRLIALNSVCQ